MSKPKKEVQENEYYKDIHFLYEVIARLRKKDAVRKFLKDILTPSELRMLKRRWHIACELENESTPVRIIAKKTETGTDTVLRVARKLKEGEGGLREALKSTYRERNKVKTVKQGVSATFGSYVYTKTE